MKKDTKSFLLVFSGFTVLFIALSIGCFILAPKDLKGLIAAPAFPVSYEAEETEAIAAMRERNKLEPDYEAALSAFSSKTASHFLKGATENTTYSPISLYYALALAGTGAKGETQSEIYDLLGTDDTKFLSEQSGNLYRLIYADNLSTKTRVANSVWLDKSASNDEKTKKGDPLVFREKFMLNGRENLYSTMFNVDFKDPETALSMQKWVKQYTGGAIDAPITLENSQLMAILNTIYFSDEWQTEFSPENSSTADFILSDKTAVSANYMSQSRASHQYCKGENFTRAALPLKGNNEMVFFLPDDGAAPADLLASPEAVSALFAGENQKSKVNFTIPKFSYSSKLDLADMLKSLGLNSAFSDTANFSDITSTPIMLDKVSQQTLISLDEKGVQAAAFTKLDAIPSDAPSTSTEIEMNLNRPFVYAITTNGGMPLFIGVCQNPVA